MSKSKYSEEAAVQIPAGELLRDKLKGSSVVSVGEIPA